MKKKERKRLWRRGGGGDCGRRGSWEPELFVEWCATGLPQSSWSSSSALRNWSWFMMIPTNTSPWYHGTILITIIILESHSIGLALHKVFRLSWHLEEWEILTTCCLKILQIHKMSCCQLYLGALCRLIIFQIKSFPNLPESISAVSSELVLHAEALHRRPQRTRNWERNARRQKSLGLIGGQFSERGAIRNQAPPLIICLLVKGQDGVTSLHQTDKLYTNQNLSCHRWIQFDYH